MLAELPASSAVRGTSWVTATRYVQKLCLRPLCRHGNKPAASAVAFCAALRERLYQEIGQLKVELDWLKKKHELLA